MSSPTSVYFVLVNYGQKIGRCWIERDPASMDWQSTVDDVASGEIGDMIEIRRAEDWADVTEKLAWEVSAKWADAGEPLTYRQYSFVEQTIGTRAARHFVRAA